MQLSIVLLSSLSLGYAFAQGNAPAKTGASPASTGAPNASGAGGVKTPTGKVKVHVVKVGANKETKFEPNKLTAEVGDMVQFQFAGGNHTVSQSTFDKPCEPISMVDPKVPGFYSGYMPTAAATDMLPTYTIMISNMTPLWIYCAQTQHCQKGMTMVINENLKANASRTLENFTALAAKAVTVQMKADNKTPSAGGAAPQPSGASKPSDKGPALGAGSGSTSGSSSSSSSSKSSSSSNVTISDDPTKIPTIPNSASGKNSASIIMSALAGLLAFAIVM